jgi:hypothetical protein
VKNMMPQLEAASTTCTVRFSQSTIS